MAANLKEAVENLKQFSMPFRSMLEFVDQITPFADIEQAIAEAEGALQAKRSEVDSLERQKIAAAAEAEDLRGSAQVFSDKLIADAKTAAAQILSDAQAKAAEDAKAVTDAAQAEADAAAQRAADAQTAQDDAEAKRDVAQAELDALEGRIGDAKAQMAKMLGA